MSANQLCKELVRFSRLCYQRRLVGATGGNLSVRLDKNSFLVTPSGVSLRDISYENLIITNQEGKKLKGDKTLKPSKETMMHISVYNNFADANAVIHLHPPYVTAFSVKGISLPMLTVSSELKLGEVPVVERAGPGSSQLVENIEKTLQESGRQTKCLMLVAHGLISFASSLSEAYDIAELTEETAKISFISQNISRR